VLSGYSQGAVVMHRAAVKMEKSILNRIIATVTVSLDDLISLPSKSDELGALVSRRLTDVHQFGDGGQQATKDKPIYQSPVGPIPVWPEALDGKIRFNCAKGDLVSLVF